MVHEDLSEGITHWTLNVLQSIFLFRILRLESLKTGSKITLKCRTRSLQNLKRSTKTFLKVESTGETYNGKGRTSQWNKPRCMENDYIPVLLLYVCIRTGLPFLCEWKWHVSLFGATALLTIILFLCHNNDERKYWCGASIRLNLWMICIEYSVYARNKLVWC